MYIVFNDIAIIYFSSYQLTKEALASWPPAAPLVKKEVLLPSMLGRDSWGRQRRLYGEQRSLALTVNTLRSAQSKLATSSSKHFTGTFSG